MQSIRIKDTLVWWENSLSELVVGIGIRFKFKSPTTPLAKLLEMLIKILQNYQKSFEHMIFTSFLSQKTDCKRCNIYIKIVMSAKCVSFL